MTVPGGVAKRLSKYVILAAIYPLVLAVRWTAEGSQRTDRFQSCSELLSLIPFQVGIVAREQFYSRTLRSCGRGLVTRMGTVILYPDISVGRNVLVGRHCVIGLVDIGDDVMFAHRVSALSGRHHHSAGDATRPISSQPGTRTRISIGEGSWIGADATVMADVGIGAIVGAGAVVVRKVEEHDIVAGNPARSIRKSEPR